MSYVCVIKQSFIVYDKIIHAKRRNQYKISRFFHWKTDAILAFTTKKGN
jgi:hypothetical protein